MPTYQYVCTECGDQIEVVQKFTDDPLTVHETDGGRLRKVFSPVGIVFKGSGFYRTDSRADSRKAAAAPAAASSSSSGEGSSPDSPSSSSSSGGEKSGKSEQPAAASSGGDKPGSSGPSSPAKAAGSGEKVA